MAVCFGVRDVRRHRSRPRADCRPAACNRNRRTTPARGRRPRTPQTSPRKAQTPTVTPMDETVPDCRTCGACCYGDEMWIHIMADDDERLGEGKVHHLTVLT